LRSTTVFTGQIDYIFNAWCLSTGILRNGAQNERQVARKYEFFHV
jgi:hypothetical protein